DRKLQRIGLSATCSPLATAARFLSGTHRPCAIAVVPDAAPLHLTIEPLEGETDDPRSSTEDRFSRGFMARLLDRLEPELRQSPTCLIFTNARSLAERLVWALRRRYPAWAEEVAVHHSSLAKKRRREVERHLKKGRLRAVVSSTSLELGIDIGTVGSV